VRAAAASGFCGIRGGLVVVVVFFFDEDEDERFQVQIDHLHHLFDGI